MNLYIYKYNNYYNRIVKQEDTLAEYGEPIHRLIDCKDFSPNDGVNTIHVFGSAANNYNGSGDYLIVSNEYDEIISRWFIIETSFTRTGQWNINLRRDLIVDYYDTIISAPCFIEKATLTLDDPLIFNNEQMTFNQIKKGEYLIENNLKTPWVVAYLSRKDGEGNYNTFSGEFKFEREPITPDYILDSLDEYEFSNWVDTSYLLTNDIDFQVYYYDETDSEYRYMCLFHPGSFTSNFYAGGAPLGSNPSSWPKQVTSVPPFCLTPVETYNTLKSVYDTYTTVDSNGVQYNSLTNIGTDAGFLLLSNEIGKTIKVGDKFYEITADIGVLDYNSNHTVRIVPGTSLYQSIFTNFVEPSSLYFDESTVLFAEVALPFKMNKITLKIKNIPQNSILQYNFTYDKAVTTDAIYEIIAVPLKTTSLVIKEGDQLTPFVSSGSVGLQWFQDIYTSNNTKVYDIQIVPYIALDSMYAENYEYISVYEKDNPQKIKAIALKLKQSSFNSIISIPDDITLNSNIKINSETELWRITSPNGIGNFEFNPYKNKGWNFIEIDCTLIPINPYIKIVPIFNPNGLYGGDYNDFRGLICGGDFSIALSSSEWQTYQQQNKNFQNIFDRQIQSMEVQNKYGRVQDIVGAIAGTGSGAAAGALTGSMIAPGIGTAIGAAAGGILSAGGGIADIAINETLRNEALDLTKDQFGYQLGNIQARANTLTRTTAFNINNKYFPYIEYYTCTDREKRALANKIAYNGMTVMTIGTIQEYIGNEWSYEDIKSKGYIKGQLIRIEDLDDEYHLLKEIANEINKGVYF